jgi:hypothetical protein
MDRACSTCQREEDCVQDPIKYWEHVMWLSNCWLFEDSTVWTV